MTLADAVAYAEKNSLLVAGSAAQRIADAARMKLDTGPQLATADIRFYAAIAAGREAGAEKPKPLYLRDADAKPQAGFVLATAAQMMRIPFLTPRVRDYSLEPLSANDSPAIAALHQEDFHRPWTDGEFASLLEQDTVFGFVARETGRGAQAPVGFVLARLAAGEAEILTIAVARTHRRQGLGWKLMDAVLRELHRERAEALFLEVDETQCRGDRSLPPLRLLRGRQAPELLPVGRAALPARLSCAAIFASQ